MRNASARLLVEDEGTSRRRDFLRAALDVNPRGSQQKSGPPRWFTSHDISRKNNLHLRFGSSSMMEFVNCWVVICSRGSRLSPTTEQGQCRTPPPQVFGRHRRLSSHPSADSARRVGTNARIWPDSGGQPVFTDVNHSPLYEPFLEDKAHAEGGAVQKIRRLAPCASSIGKGPIRHVRRET